MRILIELLKNVDQERSKVYMESKQNLSQFDVMIEIIIGALTHLAKDSLCKSIVKEMDPISVIIRVRSRGKAERSNFLLSGIFSVRIYHPVHYNKYPIIY